MTSLNQPWSKIPIIAIDTETSGQYPLYSELCEVAALKYINGEIVDSYQTLIKPTQIMNQKVIDIHNITNEMVADAPSVKDVIRDIHDFVYDGVIIGHHSPFDIGFLTIEFEKFGLKLPKNPALCSSLLSRNLISGVANHKLQTLIKHFSIKSEAAHRAFDDAKACYEVAVHCFRKIGMEATLNDIIRAQEKELFWKDYSMTSLKNNAAWACLLKAIDQKQDVQITYQGGSQPGQTRVVKPISIVRNPMGDFLVAYDDGVITEETKPKRFQLRKLTNANL